MHEWKGLLHPESICLFWSSSVTVQYSRSPSALHGHSSKAAAPAFPHQNEAYRTCAKPEAYPKSSCHHPEHDSQLEHPRAPASASVAWGMSPRLSDTVADPACVCPVLTLWSCMSIIVASILTNMFHVALNFIQGH